MKNTWIAGEPHYNWLTFERGFDTIPADRNLPRCEQCKDFPEKFEVGRLVREWRDPTGQFVAHHELLDTEIRIECHGKRWSLNGAQAAQFLAAALST